MQLRPKKNQGWFYIMPYLRKWCIYSHMIGFKMFQIIKHNHQARNLHLMNKEGGSLLGEVRLESVWCTPKLLDRLKCEFEVKTLEKQGVEGTFLGS
jgi:hypothetical protein